jgi:alpha-beta hydrolase superfamily lysophospholipase
LANRDLDRKLKLVAPRISQPILLMLAGHDQIIDNAATRAFVQRFASTRRTIFEYSDARHTLEFEPDRQLFVNDLVEWLRSTKCIAGIGRDSHLSEVPLNP